MHIRLARPEDLAALTALEAVCFPAAEAATEESFRSRLAHYAGHFWLLEDGDTLVSFVNGLVTNERDLTDEMYENAAMHDENGAWQMIFGVVTHPDYPRRGCAEKLLRYVVEQARQQGYVVTLFGRRRALPELKSSNFNLRSFGERVALNMPIQGTAADIMKLAMVAVEKRLKRELPEAKLVLQVHDELIVECPEPQAEAAAKLLEEEMEQVAHLSVPLTAEAHWGRNWLEAKG